MRCTKIWVQNLNTTTELNNVIDLNEPVRFVFSILKIIIRQLQLSFEYDIIHHEERESRKIWKLT